MQNTRTVRAPRGERACTSCLVYTRFDVLVDASDRSPLLGLICPACDDQLTAEEHDDESCTCSACARHGRAAPVLRVVEGFDPERRALLGALLAEDELAESAPADSEARDAS